MADARDVDVRLQINPSPTTRQLAARVEALTRRLAEVEKLAGRVEALECRVGVAPRLPHFEPSPALPDVNALPPEPVRDAGVRRDVLGAPHAEQ